jgi:inorganic pyrophosphatase
VVVAIVTASILLPVYLCTCLSLRACASIELAGSWASLMFPLAVSASGIVVCIAVSFLATDIMPVQQECDVQSALKMQLVASTIAMTPVLYGVATALLPERFCVKALSADGQCAYSTPTHAFVCLVVGLWAGLIVGLITEYYTSHSYSPVREVTHAVLLVDFVSIWFHFRPRSCRDTVSAITLNDVAVVVLP